MTFERARWFFSRISFFWDDLQQCTSVVRQDMMLRHIYFSLYKIICLFFWDLYDDFSILFEFCSTLSYSTKLQSILVVIFCRISFGSITRSFTSPSYSHESTPDTLREDGMMQIRTRSGREREKEKDELSEKPNLNFSSFLSYSETRV